MKQRQLAKTVLVLIIFFSFGTVLGVVGYLAANNKVNFGGSSTFTRLNPGSAGDISGWKTYKNERYGYEVMYPSYLVPSEQDNGDRVFFNDPVDPQKRMAYEIDMDRSLAGVFGTPNPGTIKEIGKSQERGEKYAKTYWIQEKLNVGGLDGLILRVDQPGLNLYSLFPYHDRWFFISFEGSLDDLRKTLSTLKFNAFEPKKDLGKDLGIDIFSFVPEGTDRSGNRLYKKPRVTDVKVGNIDGDQVKEIVFAIDNDNMNAAPREQVIILDKDKYSGGSYRETTGFQMNYFQDIYGFGSDYIRQAGKDPGLVKSELDLRDIDRDGMDEILYYYAGEKGGPGIFSIKKFTGVDKNTEMNSYNEIFDGKTVGGGLESIKDLDGDGIPEIEVYKNVLGEDITSNEKVFRKIQTYGDSFKDYPTPKEDFPEEYKKFIAEWPDIYKWDGKEYSLADDKFPDKYADFIKSTQEILKDSRFANKEIRKYRSIALNYQPSIVVEALPGEGITNLARKAIAQFLDKFYGSEYLDGMKKLYAEDYLKLRLKNKYGRLQPGDTIEFPLNLIDEAVLKTNRPNITKTYKNNKLGFQLTLPDANWYLPAVSDNDPHFYADKECASSASSQCAALEIQGHDSEFTEGLDSTLESLKETGQNPAVLSSLIPGAITIKSNAPGAAEGWSYEYDVFFETAGRRFLIFTSDGELEKSILPTFAIMKNNKVSGGCPGTIRDVEGNIYDTVKIGTQCWTKENLKVAKNPDGEPITRYCYKNDPNICNTDGGLYDWDTAMNNSAQEGVQGICPDGWHVPKDSEWSILENYLKDPGQSCDSERRDIGGTKWTCVGAGSKLKAGGVSGFESVLAGFRDIYGSSNNRGEYAQFWSSKSWSIDAWIRVLSPLDPGISRTNYDKQGGFSVRCLKD